MISAFGIDHGGVSKALKVVRVPKGVHVTSEGRAVKVPGGKRPSKAQKRTVGGNPGAPTRTQRFTGAMNRIGEADVSLKGIGSAIGRAGTKTSSLVERHPGLTGTAAVGGGSAAGYSYLSRKEPKR